MRRSAFALITLVLFCPLLGAQDAVPVSTAASVVPHLVRYSGLLPQAPASASVVDVTFALYQEPSGGDALWSEVQQVTLDAAGKYSVLLGATNPAGLPHDLFANGDAKWLGVTLAGSGEMPRALLSASAYSLKASDAETLGGHPASDFALAQKNISGKALTNVTTISGSNGVLINGIASSSATGPTVALALDGGYLSTLGNSIYAQINEANTFKGNQTITGNTTINGALTVSGTINSAFLNGIAAGLPTLAGNNTLTGTNTFSKLITSTVATGTAPFSVASTTVVPNLNASLLGGKTAAQFATLAANQFTGAQALEPTGTATASAGFNSAALGLYDSIYNSSTAAAVSQGYVFQTEAAFNDVASPVSTLNLLYSNGTGSPKETGFYFGSDGHINFASGQSFPGAGTITGITTTSPLSGSGTSGSVALSLNTAALETTLNSVYPQLNAAINSFSGAVSYSASESSYLANFQNNNSTAGYGIEASGYNGSSFSGSNYGAYIYGTNYGVYSTSGSTGTGVYASGLTGVNAVGGTTSGGYGVTASGFDGIHSQGGTTGGSTVGASGQGVYAGGYIGVVGSGSMSAGGSGVVAGMGVYGLGYDGVYGLGNIGVAGVSSTTTGVGVQANGGTASGGYGMTANGYTGLQATGNASSGTGVNASGGSYGVYANGGDGYGMYATGGVGLQAVGGASAGGIGVTTSGYTAVNATGGALGIYASGSTGVQGVATSSTGAGVVGQYTAALSAIGASGASGGVWGDAGTTGDGVGVTGTGDDANAMEASNDSATAATLYVFNESTATTGSTAFFVDGSDTYCEITHGGVLTCSGSVSVVPVRDDGRSVKMYAPQATENWFEDYGSGHLTSGSAHISLDKDFAAMVNAGVEYHVFLTPRGDCNGLYVGEATAEGFDVHELKGGNSTLAFDYKIVAKRKGMEAERMQDITEQRKQQAEDQAGRRRAGKPRRRTERLQFPRRDND